MSVDIDDVRIGDIMFMGGHLVRRVWTTPREDTHLLTPEIVHRRWPGLHLDRPTDGSAARYTFYTPVGQPCLILRSTTPRPIICTRLLSHPDTASSRPRQKGGLDIVH